jgi:flagellar assembly protein FliH
LPRIIKRADVSDTPVVVREKRGRGFVRAGLDGHGTEEPVVEPQASEEEAVDPRALAMAQAAEILADAEARADAMVREAAARGYADGKEEGLKAAEEQTKGYLERLATLAKQAVIDREAMIRSAERELATLALEVASKVIRREVSCDPTVVLNVVEAALEKVGSTDSVKIVVHPEDAELVREKWAEMKGSVAFGPNWEVVADEWVERGGCLIETKNGTVDSRLEAQIAEIVSAFEVGR